MQAGGADGYEAYFLVRDPARPAPGIRGYGVDLDELVLCGKGRWARDGAVAEAEGMIGGGSAGCAVGKRVSGKRGRQGAARFAFTDMLTSW